MDKRLLTRFLVQLGSSLQGNPFPQVHKGAAQVHLQSSTQAMKHDCKATTQMQLYLSIVCLMQKLPHVILCSPLLQAAPSDPLVALLKAQGLSLLMRQYIMYAVAMADSDQESVLAQQTSATAADKHRPTDSQHLPQSGTHATPGMNKAVPAPSTPHSPSQSAPQAASAQHPQARSDALDQDVATSSNPPQSQLHAPGAVRPSSSGYSDPHTPPDTSTQPSSNNSRDADKAVEDSQSDLGPPVSAGVASDSLMSVEDGVTALRQYLSSVGRYGPNSGAFLTPMYGCAELPQAFCRCNGISGTD